MFNIRDDNNHVTLMINDDYIFDNGQKDGSHKCARLWRYFNDLQWVKNYNRQHIWNFLSHWKKPSVSDDGVCSLNLMLSCCNTHPVANQESFHKSQGQLQQQLTIRNAGCLLLILPLLPAPSIIIVYIVRLPWRESFCACLLREVNIDFCHIVELSLFMFGLLR